MPLSICSGVSAAMIMSRLSQLCNWHFHPPQDSSGENGRRKEKEKKENSSYIKDALLGTKADSLAS